MGMETAKKLDLKITEDKVLLGCSCNLLGDCWRLTGKVGEANIAPSMQPLLSPSS